MIKHPTRSSADLIKFELTKLDLGFMFDQVQEFPPKTDQLLYLEANPHRFPNLIP